VEAGRCDSLLAHDGPYRRLWRPLAAQDARAMAST
jgi:hypothetical protein